MRHCCVWPSALFFFDLDRFKHINDTYGHSAGDRLLVQIAEMLRTRLRDNDILGRLGGDEFVAIIHNVNRKSAQETGASLLAVMQDFTFYEGVDAVKIYFSVGITMITDGRATPQHYLKQADVAVHEAKAQGRNRFFFYEPDTSSVDNNLDNGWYKRIHDAIEYDQFQFYFQPLYGLKEQGEQVFEVLLRLPDLHHGILGPGGFFPAAERFGMMPEIDRLVLRKSIQILARDNNQNLVLSINFSDHIFEDDLFVEVVEQLVNEYQVETRRLIFEISEQVAVRHMERLRPLFNKLVALGVRCAIDDFASGFASFSYVKQFPVQFLKINGTLIERVAIDSVDRITVNSIVAMAAELGMETVAKFVPNEECLSVLQSLGVDYAQGDYVGAPKPSMEKPQRLHHKPTRRAPRK
jgi:diguanylate cyclase (GGDEF)-like protein